MNLTRQEYVAICETCLHRELSSSHEIICSLTGTQANFESVCHHFEKDQLAIERAKRIKQHKQEIVEANSAINGSPKSAAQVIIGGIVILACGAVLMVVSAAASWTLFYPVLLIISGIITLVKGLLQKAKEIQKPNESEILDAPSEKD